MLGTRLDPSVVADHHILECVGNNFLAWFYVCFAW